MSSSDLSDALWRKSSYSNGQANCVEAALTGEDSRQVAVRDSKVPAGPVLTFQPSVWQRFAASVKAGQGTEEQSAPSKRPAPAGSRPNPSHDAL